MKKIFLIGCLAIVSLSTSAQILTSEVKVEQTNDLTTINGKLDLKGNLLFETGSNPIVYTGTGTSELNRFLALINSPNKGSASGLKAGGVLVSDTYAYGNPGKNDLVVKGKIGIGTPSPQQSLDIRGNLLFETGSNPIVYTGTGTSELNRFLALINSPNKGSASGLKAGGVLVSDTYAYGNPGKNDLVVKGKIGVGTPSPNFTVDINGSLNASSLYNSGQQEWSDFVFDSDYELRELNSVEKFIKERGHLPDIPSESEVTQNGYNIGNMDAKLLQKIEELTLYMIEMNKQVQQLKSENQELKEKVQLLENQ